MKYKTLVRLTVKVLGIYLVVAGLGQLCGALVYVVGLSLGTTGVSSVAFWRYLSMLGSPAGNVVLGLYLFFGGTWVVNKIVPSNRPYCPECGCELTGLTGARCPECGVQLPTGLVGGVS